MGQREENKMDPVIIIQISHLQHMATGYQRLITPVLCVHLYCIHV